MKKILKEYIFIFDLAKSESNQRKHGIDFLEAQNIWNDPDRIFDVPASYSEYEERWLAVGRIGEHIWTACYCYRGSRIRLISVRAARELEKEQYEFAKRF